MTELMKRYEAETGKRAKKKVLVMYSTKRYGWGREKNHLFFTNKFVKWLMNLLDYLEVETSDANRRIATLESNVRMYKYENTQLKAQLTWRPVSEKPEKGQVVLASYPNSYGKRRRVRAVYIRQYEEEVDDDCEAGYEYSEENDLWYLIEGWYELIDNWNDYTSVAIVEGVVDYWLPIPPAPEVKV